MELVLDLRPARDLRRRRRRLRRPTDEGLLVICFPDTDDDTYAPGDAGPIASCPAEGRATVGASERPKNGVDDDCDGLVDEATTP
jgi:hypothetical protein